jgi:hypothetical protein
MTHSGLRDPGCELVGWGSLRLQLGALRAEGERVCDWIGFDLDLQMASGHNRQEMNPRWTRDKRRRGMRVRYLSAAAATARRAEGIGVLVHGPE